MPRRHDNEPSPDKAAAPEAPKPAAPAPAAQEVLALQQAAGNAAVSRLVARSPLARQGDGLDLVEASTPESRAQGLSGVDSVPGDGMLFSFDSPTDSGFHMRDTKVPLDLVTLDSGGTVQEVAPMTPQGPSNPQGAGHTPSAPYSQAIELPQGGAAAHGLEPGAPAPLARSPREDGPAGDPVARRLARAVQERNAGG